MKYSKWAAQATCAAVFIWAGSTFRKASIAVNESRAELAAKDVVRFDSALLDRHPRPGFDPLSSPAQFSDVAFFQNHIFLCGPGGLAEYDSDGALLKRYRPGSELPAAPLEAQFTATVGHLRRVEQ